MKTWVWNILAAVFSTLLLSGLSHAAAISGNIHAELTDNNTSTTDIFPRIGFFSYDDSVAAISNRRPLTALTWDGADVNFDLTADSTPFSSASAVFDGSDNFIGLDVVYNDSGAADLLTLQSNGAIDPWSTSEGPFGTGVYATSSTDILIQNYVINAELQDDNDGSLTGSYPSIGTFSFDANAIVNSRAKLESFSWAGVGIDFDLSTLAAESVVSAFAILDSVGSLLGIDVEISDSPSADALKLLSDGTVEFWSTSEGPFGDGTYSFARANGNNDPTVPVPAPLFLIIVGIAGLVLRLRTQETS